MDQNSEEFMLVPSPIQVLIKDEVHEDIIFDFNDEPSQLSQSSTQPHSASDSDDLLQVTTSVNRLVDDLALYSEETASDQLKTTKYYFRNRQKEQALTSVPDQNASESPFYCKVCAICHSSKELFDIHQSGHQNNLRCSLCTTILKNFKNYEKHVTKCKPFECQICGKTIRFRPNFIKHMRIHNPKNVSTTTTTTTHTTTSADALTDGDGSNRSSQKVPKAERHKYKCATCDKEFTSWEYFKVHQKIHVDDVNLKCDICDRTFSALACLRGHQKVHTGERPFRCDVCGKSFGQSYNLKIHSRLHSGEKPFECKICGRKMNTTASYNAHIKTHKDFKCAICNETFNQKMKYMSHMGMHETGKVLECKICGTKFGRSSNFYNHQRIHLGIKKYKCYICGHGFVKAANLDAHLLIHCDTDEMANASEQSRLADKMISATQTVSGTSDTIVASPSVSLGSSAGGERGMFVAGGVEEEIAAETVVEPEPFLFDNAPYDSMYSL